ncbi:rev protein [Simian immunodeficiency virus]|uniref:Protein Rev n=1 Tax=Simian immunodeficiency virus TaxID=11723 RepID=A4UDG7_SIV|nr:rev protein [Simian immunodeficiency virus]
MAGASENVQDLIRTCRIIRILYQSKDQAGLFSPFSTDPYPTSRGSRAARRNRRRRWQQRQDQIRAISERILVAVLGRPPQPSDLVLPDISQLSINPSLDTPEGSSPDTEVVSTTVDRD